jgi:hypothetical protein
MSIGCTPKGVEEEELVHQALGDVEMKFMDQEPKPHLEKKHEAYSKHSFV